MTASRRVAIWGLPAVIAAALIAWVAFAALLLPEMVARAYAGDGFSWLASQMGGGPTSRSRRISRTSPRWRSGRR